MGVKATYTRMSVFVGLGCSAMLMVGCASTRSIPFTIQSDPLGAYVLLQVDAIPGTESPDWIYIGNTPLSTTRTLTTRDVKQAKSVAIRVMKEGYFDQTKEWQAQSLVAEQKEKGTVFWNPKLVRSTE